jgi:hypothetical protein
MAKGQWTGGRRQPTFTLGAKRGLCRFVKRHCAGSLRPQNLVEHNLKAQHLVYGMLASDMLHRDWDGSWGKGPDMTTSVVGRGRHGFIDSPLTSYGAAAAALLVFLYACICQG